MQNPITERLNNLIKLCEDAQEFYSSASRKTNRPQLKQSFRKMASTRESVVINLKTHFVSLIGEAEGGESARDQPSKIFTFLKKKMEDTDLALVKELETAEDKTLDAFQKALSENPPEATRNILERQLRILGETRDHVRYLKKKLKDAA